MKQAPKLLLVVLIIVGSIISTSLQHGEYGNIPFSFYLGQLAGALMFGFLGVGVQKLWAKVKDRRTDLWKGYLYSAFGIMSFLLAGELSGDGDDPQTYFKTLIVASIIIGFVEVYNRKRPGREESERVEE